MQEDTPSRLVGYARPSQDMFVPQGLVAFMQTSKSAWLRVLLFVCSGGGEGFLRDRPIPSLNVEYYSKKPPQTNAAVFTPNSKGIFTSS